MARHNTCINPACGNDVAGWSGGSTPARTAVTGFGRPFAARYTSGTFSNSARGGVVAGQTYTLSEYVYIDNPVASVSGTVYIEWRDSGGNPLTYSNAPYSIPSRAVSRVSITATAPANAAFASIITDNYNFGTGPADFTMVLIEQGALLLDYFDGDSPGATWDGTPGSSSSTLTETLTGVLAGVLPPLSGSVAASAEVSGALTASLPPLTASMQAVAEVAGHTDAALPALAGQMVGDVEAEGTFAAELPALAAAAAGQATTAGPLAAGLLPLTAVVTAHVTLPTGSLTAALPALTATLAGVSDALDPEIDVRVGPPELRWPTRTADLRWPVGPPTVGRT